MTLSSINCLTTKKFILPDRWLSLNEDTACLQANDPKNLDVATSPSKKHFHLVTINFWAKANEFFNPFAKKARYERLREYCIKTHNAFHEYPWRYDASAIKTFYTKGLAKWDPKVFDRSLLTYRIQHILCSKLGTFRKNHPDRAHLLPKKKMEWAKLQIELALKLGVRPIKNKKGVSSSIIYYDIHHKPIGIFKKEQPIKSAYTLKGIASTLFRFRNQSDICKLDQAQAEVAASLADQFFSVRLVPFTRRIYLEGNYGSFMLWAPNMKEALNFDSNHVPTTHELYLFQLMVIYDFLLGNLDRHLENWLVSSDPMNLLKNIAMIDNGNAFPEEHPSESPKDYFARNKMYKWKSHPWAKYRLQEKIIDRLEELTPSKIEEFIELLRDKLPKKAKDFFSPLRLSNLFSRAALLYEIGRLKKTDFTPSELGKAISSKKIHSFQSSLRQR